VSKRLGNPDEILFEMLTSACTSHRPYEPNIGRYLLKALSVTTLAIIHSMNQFMG
jgi:hypothetical protein